MEVDEYVSICSQKRHFNDKWGLVIIQHSWTIYCAGHSIIQKKFSKFLVSLHLLVFVHPENDRWEWRYSILQETTREKALYIFTGYFMDGGATECKLLGNSEKLDQCSNQKQEIYFVWPNFKYHL